MTDTNKQERLDIETVIENEIVWMLDYMTRSYYSPEVLEARLTQCKRFMAYYKARFHNIVP